MFPFLSSCINNVSRLQDSVHRRTRKHSFGLAAGINSTPHRHVLLDARQTCPAHRSEPNQPTDHTRSEWLLTPFERLGRFADAYCTTFPAQQLCAFLSAVSFACLRAHRLASSLPFNSGPFAGYLPGNQSTHHACSIGQNAYTTYPLFAGAHISGTLLSANASA